MSGTLASLGSLVKDGIYNAEFAAARLMSTPDGSGSVFTYRPLDELEDDSVPLRGERPANPKYAMVFAGCIAEIGREPPLLKHTSSLPVSDAFSKKSLTLTPVIRMLQPLPCTSWWGPSSRHRRRASVSVSVSLPWGIRVPDRPTSTLFDLRTGDDLIVKGSLFRIDREFGGALKWKGARMNPDSPVARCPKDFEHRHPLSPAQQCRAINLRYRPYGPAWKCFLSKLDVITLFKFSLESKETFKIVMEYVREHEVVSDPPTPEVSEGPSEFMSKIPIGVFPPVLSGLILRDVMHLSWRSPRYRPLLALELQMRLKSLLTQFGLLYDEIRFMQAATLTIVSGSTISHLLDTSITPSNIDFYSPKAAYPWVGRFFQVATRYEARGTVEHAERFEGITQSLRLSMPSTPLELNLFCSASDNALECTIYFPFSHLIAGITHYGFWFAYPSSTTKLLCFPNKDLVDIASPYNRRVLEGVIKKYMARGYAFLFYREGAHKCGAEYECPATVRTSVDDGCLQLPFASPPLGGLENVTEVYPEVKGVSWSLAGCACPDGTQISPRDIRPRADNSCMSTVSFICSLLTRTGQMCGGGFVWKLYSANGSCRRAVTFASLVGLLMYSLCPDGSLTPNGLLNVLEGHGRRCLAHSDLDVEYSRPPPGATDAPCVVKSSDPLVPYKFVVFGQIATEPEHSRGWPGRILISLVSPNWHSSGWPFHAFDTEFDLQISSMRWISLVESREDIADGKVRKPPARGNWADGAIKLEIRPSEPPKYHLPEGPECIDGAEFPFKSGDTIIAECSLRRLEVENSSVRHWRNFSLVVTQVKRVNVADNSECASTALTLAPRDHSRMNGIWNGRWDPLWDAADNLPQSYWLGETQLNFLSCKLEVEMQKLQKIPYTADPARWAEVFAGLSLDGLFRLALRKPYVFASAAEYWATSKGSNFLTMVFIQVLNFALSCYRNVASGSYGVWNRILCGDALRATVTLALRFFGLQHSQFIFLQTATGCVITGPIIDYIMRHAPADITSDILPRLILHVPQGNMHWIDCFFEKHTSFRPPVDSGRLHVFGEASEGCVVTTKTLVNEDKQEIVLLGVCSTNPLEPLLSSPYSPRIGGVTDLGIWHGHPRTTFSRIALPNRRFINLSQGAARERAMVLLREMQQAGYMLFSYHPRSHVCGSDACCPATTRFSNDKGCFSSRFSPSFGEGAVRVERQVNWSLDGRRCPVSASVPPERFVADRKFASWTIRWECMVNAGLALIESAFAMKSGGSDKEESDEDD
ncbi:hypothetical protein C8R43DRAFT_959694 [Mycena crocata]|nr:hypothetical protein C8R43DRAFT_959694 [Mycena crocata]